MVMWMRVTILPMRAKRLVIRNPSTSVFCSLSSRAQVMSKLLRAESEVMALGALLLLILREACMSSAEA